MRASAGSLLKLTASWIVAFVLILAVAAYPRSVYYTRIPGHLWAYHFDWTTYLYNFVVALRSPLTLWLPQRAEDWQQIQSHLPLSLFYVGFALTGSYVFGIGKGILDVFWRRRPYYKPLAAVAWVLDAIPMFGVVVLLELGTLYGEIYIKGFPLSMIPDQTFVGGDIVPGLILMWVPMMYLARIVAVGIHQELGEQYVLTAYSKGLPSDAVFWRHVVRNLIPKLLAEAPSVFTMILSSLLALEYLSFRWGGMFDMFIAMGHGQLGQRSLYASPDRFDLPLVSTYLLIFAVLSAVMQLAARILQRRWEVR